MTRYVWSIEPDAPDTQNCPSIRSKDKQYQLSTYTSVICAVWKCLMNDNQVSSHDMSSALCNLGIKSLQQHPHRMREKLLKVIHIATGPGARCTDYQPNTHLVVPAIQFTTVDHRKYIILVGHHIANFITLTSYWIWELILIHDLLCRIHRRLPERRGQVCIEPSFIRMH